VNCKVLRRRWTSFS